MMLSLENFLNISNDSITLLKLLFIYILPYLDIYLFVYTKPDIHLADEF